MTDIDPNDGFYDTPYDGESNIHEGFQAAPTDWLDRTATALITDTLTYEMISARARSGFTIDEASQVMANPHLVAHLRAVWQLLGTSSSILTLALSDSGLGHAHRQLLAATDASAQVQTRSQLTLAASTPGAAEVLIDDRTAEQGLVITRRIFTDEALMDLVIESTQVDAHDRYPVIAGLVVDDQHAPSRRLLFLLTPDDTLSQVKSRSEITLHVDAALTSERLTVYPTPIEANSLNAALYQEISASVAAAKLPWKDAWRRAAIATEDGHPLREAVLRGLNA